MAKKKTKPKTDSFEASLDQLRAIVAELEEGNLSLDGSLEKYELGVKHLKNCYQALETAQRKIEVLVELDENGKLKTQPFEDQASEFSSQDQFESDEDDKNDGDMDDSNVLF